MGGNTTESDVEEQLAAAPTLTEDQISQLVDALLPLAQKELPTKDADGNGMISGQCCAQMEPVVTESCMCTETAMKIVYDGLKSRGITDLNNYGKLIAGIMDKLQCSAQQPGVLPLQRVPRLPALGPVLRVASRPRGHPLAP